MQTVRYNGYPSMRISGGAAPGRARVRPWPRWNASPPNCRPGLATNGRASRGRKKLAGSQALLVYAFAILAVFLCLAALYESWSIPLAVILVVPLGCWACCWPLLRGYANDVYFQVGLVTIIGLSAKNAILIIEFAKDLRPRARA